MKEIVGKINNEALTIILAGPSGVGKGRVTKHLLKNNSNLKLSVSATTRSPREDEMHGKDYFFLTDAEFDAAIRKNEFIEWIQSPFGRYGTFHSQVIDNLSCGNDLILDIEPHGASKIMELLPNTCSFFFLPPTIEELKLRLEMRGIGRGINNEEDIQSRVSTIYDYINYAHSFDFVFIINKAKETAPIVADIIKMKKYQLTKDRILAEWTSQELKCYSHIKATSKIESEFPNE